MNLKRTLATCARVLKLLKHDHRTIALILFVPSVLIIILNYVFEDSSLIFESVAPLLLGILPFTLMFIVTSVAVLRERTSGTLERLLTLPISKLDILFGYGLAFALLAFLQAAIASFVILGLLDVQVAGSIASLLVVAVMAGVLGMSLGLFFSSFAKNEFQAVQFMPAFVLPQFLTCGLFVPREQMAQFLQYFSDVMPITYVVEAMQEVKSNSLWTHELSKDLLIIAGFVILSLLLGALSLRRSAA
ncbi:MAG TPA: ABC transporter permease [Candidatus Saccharimonadales bacterium]|nr:ABC transporter permease [Candidatus Saccharimonadales bacterium]